MTEHVPQRGSMQTNDPPRTVSTTGQRDARAGGQTPAAAHGGPTWPGLTTAQSLAVASQFGVTLAVGVGLGVFAGQWLDGVVHTGIALTLIGALVGLVAGVTSTVAMYRATLRKSSLEWRDEGKGAASRAAASHRRSE